MAAKRLTVDQPAAVRRIFQERNARRETQLASSLRRLGIDQLAIDTQGDYLASLRRFFANRERRFR